MTHYTVITARPVMRAFDDAMKATKVLTDDDETRAYAVAQYDAAVLSGDTNRASWCEWAIGVLMKAEAKRSSKRVQKDQGLSGHQIAGQIRANRRYRGPSTAELVLAVLREKGEAEIADIAREIGFIRQTVNVAVKKLRTEGHKIDIVRTGRHSSKYVLVKEATQ